jgi:hypothetical protein
MSHTYTASFLVELVNGTHDLDTDVLKMALFTDAVTLSKTTTAYSTSGEASGTGYTAGGATMTLTSGYPQAGATDNTYDFRFEDVEWTSATFTARQALIYNSSKSNRSILVLDFGRNRQAVSDTFAVRFPLTLPPIIRLGAYG